MPVHLSSLIPVAFSLILYLFMLPGIGHSLHLFPLKRVRESLLLCVLVSRSGVNEMELISGENIDNKRMNGINAPFVSKCGFVFLYRKLRNKSRGTDGR